MDASHTGVRIRVGQPIAIGQRVEVQLDDQGPYFAKVVWTATDASGHVLRLRFMARKDDSQTSFEQWLDAPH